MNHGALIWNSELNANVVTLIVQQTYKIFKCKLWWWLNTEKPQLPKPASKPTLQDEQDSGLKRAWEDQAAANSIYAVSMLSQLHWPESSRTLACGFWGWFTVCQRRGGVNTLELPRLL